MITPDFIGQIYKDTNTGNLWRANSLTPGDWTLEVQNMQALWLPSNQKLGELIGFKTIGDMPGITELTFLQATSVNGFDISFALDLVSISFPNLTSVDLGGVSYPVTVFATLASLTSLSLPLLESTADEFGVSSCPLLTSLSIPSYTSCGYHFKVHDNATLASLSCPGLVSISGDTGCYSNTLLASVDFPAWIPTDGTSINFSDCALTATSVELILRRCVLAAVTTCSIKVNGGTSAGLASLSPQGQADAATLGGQLNINA